MEEVAGLERLAKPEFTKQAKREEVIFEGALSNLRTILKEARSNTERWTAFWAEVNRIERLFKQTRFVFNTAETRYWRQFQFLTREGRKYQPPRRDSGTTDKPAESDLLLKQILTFADDAKPPPAHDDQDYSLDSLNYARIPVVVTEEQVNERRRELQTCSATLREGCQLFHRHKESLQDSDGRHAFKRLRRTAGELRRAWDQWMLVKRTSYEDRISTHPPRTELERFSLKLNYLDSLLVRRQARISALKADNDLALEEDPQIELLLTKELEQIARLHQEKHDLQHAIDDLRLSS